MNEEFVNLKLLKRKVSPEIFHEFCLESQTCPVCFGPLTVSCDDAHEICCRKCGLVVGEQLSQTHRLPGIGASTSYENTCSLEFNKGLGSHMKKYQLYSVLARAPAHTKDLGLRAIAMRKEMTNLKPQIKNMLFWGSKLCKRYHLGGTDRRSIQFANGLGQVLRTCALVALTLTSGSLGGKKLSHAAFVWLHEKTFHNGARLREELHVSEEALNWISHVMNDVALPKGVEIFRKPKNSETEPYVLGDCGDQPVCINPKWPQEFPMIIIPRKREGSED